MMDIVDIVDNMVSAENVNLRDSIGMMNMQKKFGLLEVADRHL
jgi:hypothetical protein